MSGLFQKIALGLFLTVSLAGCPAAGPVGGAGGAPSGLNDVKGNDSPQGSDTLRDIAQEATITRPHPGGVTSPGPELGDDWGLAVKGTIQPACRNASGEIQYRIEGNLVTVKDNGEERGMCDGVDSTGQSYCDLDVDKINLRFWGGQACQSAILEVTQDTFEGFVSSREITDPSVYYFTHYDDFSLHTILFGLRHEDRFDRPSPTEKPAFTLSGNVVKVIPQAVGPASLPVGLLHPLCEPPMELAKRKITMNFLEVLPTSPDLPECIAPAPIPPVIK